jgi:hypothetical protein
MKVSRRTQPLSNNHEFLWYRSGGARRTGLAASLPSVPAAFP